MFCKATLVAAQKIEGKQPKITQTIMDAAMGNLKTCQDRTVKSKLLIISNIKEI